MFKYPAGVAAIHGQGQGPENVLWRNMRYFMTLYTGVKRAGTFVKIVVFSMEIYTKFCTLTLSSHFSNVVNLFTAFKLMGGPPPPSPNLITSLVLL